MLTIGHTEYQKGKIYKIDFDDCKIYVGSTIKTLENRLKEHLPDNRGVVYKQKDKNPKISLISDYPCKNKHKLEQIERKYMDKLGKEYEPRELNKRGNDETKKKPEIKYIYKLENEKELLQRINNKIAIKNNENKKELEVQFRDGNKKVYLSKRYRESPLEEAMDL